MKVLTIDQLQLIKFWPFCALGEGVCGGAEIFGSALLQPARSVGVSLSAFFIHCYVMFINQKGLTTTHIA